MTREQAIKILSSETTREAIAELEYYAGFNKEKTIEQIQEAMDMGAEALKQTTWVPCSERLPDDGICVLVTVNGQHNNITFVDALQMGLFSGDEGWIIDGFLDWTAPDVTAWMPLPEPYKGAEHEA